jgi:hypothetical protein
MRALPLFALLIACDPTVGDDDSNVADDDSTAADDDTTGDDDTTPDPSLFWFYTCGDPVCSGYTPSGNPLCTGDQAQGNNCAPRDAVCDPQDGCNAQLLCTDTDPAVNCPISRRAWKRDIHYLSPGEQGQLATQVLQMPLATWEYAVPGQPDGLHTGFIIEDQAPGSPAVRGDRVDLYGFTTMAVAAIQQQQKEIEALRAEVQALRAAAQDRDATSRR